MCLHALRGCGLRTSAHSLTGTLDWTKLACAVFVGDLRAAQADLKVGLYEYARQARSLEPGARS